jgi:hypothetical protein
MIMLLQVWLLNRDAEHHGIDLDGAARVRSLSQRLGFVRHTYDGIQQRNVTDGRTRIFGGTL